MECDECGAYTEISYGIDDALCSECACKREEEELVDTEEQERILTDDDLDEIWGDGPILLETGPTFAVGSPEEMKTTIDKIKEVPIEFVADRIDRLEAKIKTLQNYVDHAQVCPARYEETDRCMCGFDALRTTEEQEDA